MNKNWKIFIAIVLPLYLLGTAFGIISVYFVLARCCSASDVSGAGQLLFDILLFPTVIIGFWITIAEFRKSQALPNLKLYWRDNMATDIEENYLVLETSKYSAKTFFLMLFVKNSGKAIATWYRIAFEIPRDLARPNSESHSVRWHRGEEDCWSSGINTEMIHHEFKSNGQHALYPGEEVHIATMELNLFPQIAYPGRVYIRQSVTTDRTPIQNEVCKIKVRPENLARKVSQE